MAADSINTGLRSSPDGDASADELESFRELYKSLPPEGRILAYELLKAVHDRDVWAVADLARLLHELPTQPDWRH